MKLEVYKETEVKEEPVLRLRLIKTPLNASIALAAVNQDGSEIRDGHILEIKSDGTLYKYHDLSIPGLQLDDAGCIKEAEY